MTRATKYKSVISSPVVNPYSKISSPSPRRHSSSPRRLFQSNQSQAVLPPLPPDAPPIRQYSVENLSDMQLKVVEAARPPTEKYLAAHNEDGMGNITGASHPIVRVTAAAGTGKTTTLLHLALRCIDLNHKLVTYVTFSKASAVDAQERIQALLPPDKKSFIQASTLHSCAMRILSNKPLENEVNENGNLVHDDKFRKLIEKVCGRSIDDYLRRAYKHMTVMSKTKKEESRKMKKAYDQCLFWLAKSFNSFCIKDMSLEKLKDETNTYRHYYPLKISAFKPGNVADKLGFPLAFYSSEQSYKFFADQCVVLWEYITKNRIRTFDTEMKRAQLNEVRIPGSVLLVDECQDLDACQVDFIAKQLQYGTAIFFVGDAAQTIYSFRGAKSSNYMSLPNAIDMCLNKSWRFGPAIAQIANVSLFAKEYSPQTNNYLLNTKKQWIPYRIVGGRGEEESSICRDSLIGKAEDIGTITIVARTNFALMLRAMEIMGLGFLADGKEDDSDSDEESHYSSDIVDTDSADAMPSATKVKNEAGMPVSLKLNSVKKFHINGDGDLSGLKRWKRASKEIRYLFDLFEARKSGVEMKLPEKEFPDFSHKEITFDEFVEDVQNLELNKYVQPLSMITKYGKNTLKALEVFETKVLNKKYSAEEADFILTTCHSAKGLEWDNVEICDDFLDLVQGSYTQNAPEKIGFDFLSTEITGKSRAGWQLNLQAYGDDINLLYVAMTRAKKMLVVPSSVKKFFADADFIHYLVRDMMKTTKGTDKDDLTSFTSVNRKDKNGGRLSKSELWNLYVDVIKPLREELCIKEGHGIMESLCPRAPVPASDVVTVKNETKPRSLAIRQIKKEEEVEV